ncbi:hypothetical protein M4J06_004799 [Streptomyces coelicoflavus]|uniref:hypothetical protein n=1 Tax=Streptomyces coelicoflavus TaxID=285562 RepID=UPI00210E3721|nr:hypothetical protein [Streptomyces coelicoflavus]MCQ4200836.1 hypothetical protein [Streptomyces coelicoflavus]
MERQVNERQLSVLKWVEDGCPAGVWKTSSYKTTCQALQNRGLLLVSRKSGQWSVALTSAGRHYLAHGTYPPRESRPRKNQAAAPQPRSPRAQETPASPRKPSPPPERRVTFTEQLLQELAEAGGQIVKPGSGPDLEKWPSRVAAARRSGKIPETKELYGRWCRGGYEIKLVDIPAWRLAVLEPVPVPARLTRPHTVVRAMKSERQPLGLTRPVQGRALRLIHALITAAETEGHASSAGQTGFAPPSHRRRRASPHFTITAQGQTVGFLVLQEQDRTEHVATDKELADAKKHSWIRIPRFDYTPSERLRFVLSGGQPHRASEWSDAPGHPLEDQLAEIAQEVTLRGEAAERRRLDEIEAARQKRIRWEAAMEEARIQYAEAYRFRHFEAQEAAWRHATGLTRYLIAVRTRVEAMPPGQTRTEAEAWISWAASSVERLDPLHTPPRLPDIPEPRADDLRPFLGHWSPYGP